MNSDKFWWNINAFYYDRLISDAINALYFDVLDALGPLEGVKIDDIGCGTAELIARMPKSAIVRGIDHSPKAIALSRKKAPHAKFYEMNFYKRLPGGYKPEKIVACRSLYDEDLDKSIKLIAKHLSPNGVAVIAHPKKSIRSYSKSYSLKGKAIHALKIMPRIIHKTLRYNYALFTPEEFKMVCKKYFHDVKLESGGKGTHDIIILKKPMHL